MSVINTAWRALRCYPIQFSFKENDCDPMRFRDALHFHRFDSLPFPFPERNSLDPTYLLFPFFFERESQEVFEKYSSFLFRNFLLFERQLYNNTTIMERVE